MGSIGLDAPGVGRLHDGGTEERPETLHSWEDNKTVSNGVNALLHQEIHDTPSLSNGTSDENTNAPPPIAIVGMAMRLPGGVNCAEEFWDLLMNKRDGLCTVPETRYNIDAFYNPTKLGMVKTQHGYFLKDDPGFVDASFFSMSKYEAAKLDPQQRLLLEVVWECMENGGQTGWRGKDIGCFVGSFGEDWLDLSSRDAQDIDRFRVLGTGDFALSNRISYEYDLKGPSITFRTGCSSSMVGLHEACQALYSGECSSALVAGTNLILSPTMTTTMSDNMVLSPSGICKTFDAEADGYGRGEAINAIYIKKLDDAVRSGDPVRAVIRSTSTNCDGRTPSITTPGSETQEQLIRKAYSKAKIQDLSETAFFECHGTGTIVGDTAETSVVAKLFGEKGIYIGAVKPNVGHSEGASGITSIIKAVLTLENKVIPPNIHFTSPNPKIPFQQARLQVPLEQTAWPQDRGERVSVNCFGIGGANAHVILESASSFCRQWGNYDPPAKSAGPWLLSLSARSAISLQGQIDGLLNYLQARPATLNDLAYTLGARREHLTHRAFLVLKEKGQIDNSSFEISRSTKSAVVFVFTGQGAQWPGMGKKLLLMCDSFRNDIRRMDRALQSLKSPPCWSIEEELSKDEGDTRVDEAEFAQPLCTAVQVGLVNLLSLWDILPTSVIGHSSGEIAAAYAAGAITAEAALIIAYFRGQVSKSLMHGTEQSGGMAAVGISPEKARSYLVSGVVVACENSPQSVTLSGDSDKLDEVLERIRTDEPETFCRRLRVEVAYHSHHMQDLGEPYMALITPHITLNESMIPLYSSVTAKVVSNPHELNAAYWRQNLLSPVLFSTAVECLLEEKEKNVVFLEIGPHSALSGPLRQIFQSCGAKEDSIYVPTLLRGEEEMTSLLKAAGRLYLHGSSIGFSAINGPGEVLTDLPPYPWQHDQKYWGESRVARDWRLRQHPHHELLGSRLLESSALEPAWRNLLYTERVPWLWDHKICKDVIFPCAGYIAIAGEAIRQITGSEDYSIKNLFMKTPLILQDFTVTELVTGLRPVKLTDSIDSRWYDFTITSYDGSVWKKHCVGQVRSGPEEGHLAREIVPFIRQISPDPWYRALKRRGLDYGPRFRGLKDITASPIGYKATATLYDDYALHESNYALHPTVIDQSLQLLSVAATHGISRRMTKLSIPASIEKIYINKGNGPMSLEVGLSNATSGTMCGDAIVTLNKEVVLSMEGGLFFTIDEHDAGESNIRLASRLEWKPDIDFIPAADLLPPGPPTQLPMHLVAKITAVFIIETAYQIRGSNPTSSHLKKYQAWINSQVALMRGGGTQDLVPEAQGWVALDSKSRSELLEKLRNMIESDAPKLMPLINVAQKVFEGCSDIIEGRLDPLNLLMEEDGLKNIYELSAERSHWTKFLSLLGHSNPILRVLEIGAGTGGATTAALKGLMSADGTRMYSKYTFTDISSGFIPAAKENFKRNEGLEYKVLDISRDPLEQGFEAGTYDLVIAANVFHATPSLSTTLRNVRTLLAPGGRLLFQELCPVTPSIDYMMGLLPGWWLGESDQRTDKPHVSPERWDEELRRTGFTGAEVVTYDVEQPYQFNAHILSRALENGSTKERINLLYYSAIGEWGRNLEKQLLQEGYVVNWCTLERTPIGQDIISLLDLEGPFFHNISEEDYGAFQRYLSVSNTSRTLWVTQSAQMRCEDPRFSLVLGLARTVRHEMMLDFATFEVDKFDSAAGTALIQVYRKFQGQKDHDWIDPDYEFVLQNGVVHIGRFHWVSLTEQLLCSPEPTTPKTLKIGTYGIMDTLSWSQTEMPQLLEDEVEISIKYIGLNFRDIMVSLGVVGDMSEFGFEASAVVCRVGPDVKNIRVGDRVMVGALGLLCTRKVVSSKFCIPIPEKLSLRDGATMPCVYATVIHSLINLGNLQPGQSVLIQSACGGVGLAAIQICQATGAEIYATVGNEQKVQYLMDTFQIPRDHIFDSRSTSFLPGITRQTNGRGVDIVLNSLSGELLHASWQCVAKLGKMIELGKRDFMGHAMLSMDAFASNRAFFGVDLIQLGEADPEALRRLFHQCVAYFEQEKIQPIRPINVFPAAQIVQAFRFMQTGSHIGKIVVEMPDDPAGLPVAKSLKAFSLSPDASYLLVGGLGGLGRAVTTWMVENGARNFVFLSRSAGKSNADKAFLQELEVQNCNIAVVAGSVANLDDVKQAVAVCSRPLAGVIQMSMVLRDQLLLQMTHDDWNTALAPKVAGTWNLHNVLQAVPLDFFVLFSSVVALGGNIGQANYAAANTFLDSFVGYRHSKGLPASVINLGFMQDIGFVSQNPKLLELALSISLQMLDEQDLLSALQLACSQPMSHGESLAIGLGSNKPLSDPGVRPLWARDARFSLYKNLESPTEKGPNIGSEDLKEFIGAIERNPALLDEKSTEDLVTKELGKLVGSYMSASEEMDSSQVAIIAIDSLMCIEIRSWVRRNLGLDITLVEISSAGTVGGLTKTTIKALRAKYQPKPEGEIEKDQNSPDGVE